MLEKISIITPVYNNIQDLNKTIISLSFIEERVELIVVDSSSDSSLTLQNLTNLKIKYKWIPPRGVYNALNEGIKMATREYILCLNSGDEFIDSGFHYLSQNYKSIDLSMDVLLFSQISVYNDLEYIYTPSIKDIWPHQSVIYLKSLHNKYGLYNEEFKIISDQLFFEKIKLEKETRILNVNAPLSKYSVIGISSQISLAAFKEFRLLNKVRKKNNFNLVLRFTFLSTLSILGVNSDKYWFLIKKIFIHVRK